jgi:hypothetical protein
MFPVGATIEIVPAENLHVPIVPHSKAGVKCNGAVVPELAGDQVMLTSASYLSPDGLLIGLTNVLLFAIGFVANAAIGFEVDCF